MPVTRTGNDIANIFLFTHEACILVMNHIQKALFAIVLASGQLCSTTASARPKFDPEMNTAVDEFLIAQKGSDAQKKQSAVTFDKILSASPANSNDPLILVFAGAATATVAKTTWLPWSKLQYAWDGIAHTDKALKLLEPRHDAVTPGYTPVSKEVKFVAASFFLELPSFFNRRAAGEKLLQGLMVGLDTDPTPPDYKASVYLLAGQDAANEGSPDIARKWLEKAVAYNTRPESDDAALALAKLKR